MLRHTEQWHSQSTNYLVGRSSPHSRGVWGHIPPENKFRCSEVHSGLQYAAFTNRHVSQQY